MTMHPDTHGLLPPAAADLVTGVGLIVIHDEDRNSITNHPARSTYPTKKSVLTSGATPKNWKFSAADIEERKYWKAYMSAYEDCLGATSTRNSPWYVVPADDKEYARLIVSQASLDALEGLGMDYPSSDAARRRDLQRFRKGLMK